MELLRGPVGQEIVERIAEGPVRNIGRIGNTVVRVLGECAALRVEVARDTAVAVTHLNVELRQPLVLRELELQLLALDLVVRDRELGPVPERAFGRALRVDFVLDVILRAIGR